MENKKIRLRRNGFSLVEMIISIFVFSLISLVSVSIFANVVKVQKNTRDVQKDLETSRTAIDQVAKNMRLSSGLRTANNNPSDSEIYMYNTTQNKCFDYKFTSGQLIVGRANPSLDVANNPHCSPSDVNYNLETFPITEGNITNGKFFVTKTDASSTPKAIGRATVVLTVDKEHIQTSVSFLDYAGIVQ